ncbi:MAG: dTDP-glucose 4,6-dehydratase [Kiritimatiellae bacterium]|nr:dTDP-glucose 4,6-dehydratase [Kiritimatiellia bacterium]
MRQFQNILVTGGAGFIGSNFVRHVFSRPEFSGRVVVFDALTYAGNRHNLDDVAAAEGGRYEFVHADIRDAAAVGAAMEKFDVDCVVHFAAESHVDRSIREPAAFVETNVLGTLNLLQAARARGGAFKLFHHVSTDEVFGSLGPTGFFSETTPYAPHSPYSASKAGSDHLVRAFRDTYGLPVTITNCSNNYGPYQFPEKLVPLMVLNALEGKPLPVYGEGLNVRDWLHVEDHCAAIWTVMRRAAEGETYCVGGRCEMRNADVVARVCALVDALAPAPLPSGAPRSSLVVHVADRPGHDRRYAIDCSKLERDFGWKPAHDAESGFRETVLWYLSHAEWVDSVRTGAYREWIDRNYGDRR